MTQEEKARAYDEALEDMRVIYPNLKGDAKLAVEHAFPELTESEEERIRKALIEVFKKKLERGFEWVEYGIPNRSVLDWLEKQKEQSEEPKIVFGDWGDKEKREAIITCLKYMRFVKKITNQEYDDLIKWLDNNYVKVEQKPAEKHDLLAQLREHLANTPKEQLEAEWKELEKWNHVGPTVKEYFHRIMPAEWSEEDEKDMAHIIRILDDCYVYGTHDLSKTDRENLVNKLKSLRPSWKPNEEQMKALYDACCIAFEEGRDFHPSLSRLYHDLKKL